MKEIFIIANWKMNPVNLADAERLFNEIEKGAEISGNKEIVICPPFVYLLNLKSKAENSKIKFGAQDIFWQDKGAFTGEISPLMIKNLGCDYVIIGHSERRKIIGETDDIINKKLKAAFAADLKPILCIGETAEERKSGKTEEVLKNQIDKAVSGLPPENLNNLIMAYEPTWAIGTGNPCSTDDACSVRLFLKKILQNPILYGGSVDSKNASGYIKDAGFEGLLIGGASLDSEEFIEITRKI